MNTSSMFTAFCCLVLLVTACGPASDSAASTPERPPNLIIIFADDLGYGDLGVYGHPTIRTPHLDRMAQEGMRFTQFYSGSSVCTPSRAALLTGRLPVRSGMCSDSRRVLFPDSDGGIPAEEITLAEALKEKDYATACIGKWHLGHLEPYLPQQNGFDEYFGIPYSNDMRPRSTGGRWPLLPMMDGNDVIEEGIEQTQLIPRYTERALSFIRTNKDQPFFLYYAHSFPHIPLYASEAYLGKSRRGLYGDVVEEIDGSVGQIMSTLNELGIAENTLVIFTSDNGPWLVMEEKGGSAGLLREGKGCTWEGGMREPMIAWWPGTIAGGNVTQALGTTMDLFPTALDAAGIPMPEERIYDGSSLLPVLTGQADSIRNEVAYYRGTELFAYRKGPWKLHFKTHTPYRGLPIETHDPPLLYQLDHDPSEQYNVAAQHPEVMADLLRAVALHKSTVQLAPSMLEKRIVPPETE